MGIDVDTTVKPLYGHQQDAKVGYNPSKPGRPSHAYHSYFVAGIRMVLDVEVQAGNQTAPLYAQPELWAFLDGLEEQERPVFLQEGTVTGARRKAMVGADERKLGIPVQTQAERQCEVADRTSLPESGLDGSGATGAVAERMLELSGWSKARRVVVLRRPLPSKPIGEAKVMDKKKSKRKAARQLTLELPELTCEGRQYEYAVLVTSLTDEVRAVAQHYRDRETRRTTSTS